MNQDTIITEKVSVFRGDPDKWIEKKMKYCILSMRISG